MGFSARSKPRVEFHEGLVPTEGGRQCSGVQRAAQAPPSTSDTALPLVLSAVVIEWSETSERGGLLATDASELWHPNDDSKRGTLSDARDTEHEIKTAGEVGMNTQLRDDPQYLD